MSSIRNISLKFHVRAVDDVRRMPAHARDLAWPYARDVARRGRMEKAFTLIEIVIGLVLIMILGGLVFRTLLGGVDGASKASADRRAVAEFQQARTLLSSDLRAAKAPGREFDVISSRDDLRDVITTGTSALPAGTDVEDIKLASPTALVLVADVLTTDPAAAATPECVAWRLGSNARAWWLSRAVFPYSPGCSGEPEGSYVIRPHAITGAAPAPTAVFSYVTTCASTSCGAGQTCAGSAPTPTVSGIAMNWITGVRMDLTGIVIRGNGAAKGELVSTVAMRSRLSDDYLFALGCLEAS